MKILERKLVREGRSETVAALIKRYTAHMSYSVRDLVRRGL